MTKRGLAKIGRLPSQDMLLRLLRYEPESGLLFWRDRTPDLYGGNRPEIDCASWNRRFSGKRAFAKINRDGYFCGCVLGVRTSAQRVIFKMLNGYEPPIVDHDNRDKQDNRGGNLFGRTIRENARNAKMQKNNKSGATGVHWAPHINKWIATIKDDAGQVQVGCYSEKADAVAARQAAEVRLGYHPGHGLPA